MVSFKELWQNVNPYNAISKLKKDLKVAMDGIIKPSSGNYNQSNLIYPKCPYGTFELYDFAYNSDTLSITHGALRREIFRNGYDIIEGKNTDSEFTLSDQEQALSFSDKFDNTESILKFFEEINENCQSLTDVCGLIEDDLSIIDDGFMVFLFEYGFNSKKHIISRELNQVVRGDPKFMGLVMNKFDRPAMDDNEETLYVCPIHREELITKDTCSCGHKCYPAYYFNDFGGSKKYYYKWEVAYKSKYRPSTRRGFSPIITTWMKARTLYFMDKYIMQLYDGQRPPKAGLFFKTANMDSLYKSWDEAKQRAEEHPHLPTVMAVPDSSNGQGFVQFIDFMKGLDELQHTEMRNEYRRQVGAVYGVEPVYQNDMSTSGGLNNEGLQITVTNRAIEFGQGLYNNFFFVKLMDAMGLRGWILRLNPNEEQDEMAKLQRQNQTLANGEIALSLGLEAEYDNDTGEVIIKKGKLERQETPSPFDFSGFGTRQSEAEEMTGTPNKSLKKKTTPFINELTKARSRPAFSIISNKLKKEINSFISKFKRKPSEAELQKLVAKLNLNLSNELKESTINQFKRIYLNEMDRVGKELGINVMFGTVDENALSVLANQDVLSKAFNELTSKAVDQVQEIIRDAYRDPKGLSVQSIQERIQEVSDIADYRAERIARIETSKVSMAARYNSYKKEDDFETALFKHIGPSDNRTTSTSRRIKNRTANGVTWANYVNIVTEESAKDFPTWKVDPMFPVSHFNSRHVPIKIK